MVRWGLGFFLSLILVLIVGVGWCSCLVFFVLCWFCVCSWWWCWWWRFFGSVLCWWFCLLGSGCFVVLCWFIVVRVVVRWCWVGWRGFVFFGCRCWGCFLIYWCVCWSCLVLVCCCRWCDWCRRCILISCSLCVSYCWWFVVLMLDFGCRCCLVWLNVFGCGWMVLCFCFSSCCCRGFFVGLGWWGFVGWCCFGFSYWCVWRGLVVWFVVVCVLWCLG